MANSVDFKGFILNIHNDDGDPGTFTKVSKVSNASWDTSQANVNNVTNSDSTAIEVRPGLFAAGTYTFDVIYFPTDAGQVKVKTKKYTPDVLTGWQIIYADDEAAPQTYTLDFDGYVSNFEVTGEADGVLLATLNLLVTDLPVETIV